MKKIRKQKIREVINRLERMSFAVGWRMNFRSCEQVAYCGKIIPVKVRDKAVEGRFYFRHALKRLLEDDTLASDAFFAQGDNCLKKCEKLFNKWRAVRKAGFNKRGKCKRRIIVTRHGTFRV
jgi:hypothetical protein